VRPWESAFRAAGWIGLASCLALPLRAQNELPEPARQQIAELLADKDARTPTQSKLASHLIYAARTLRGQPITPHIASLPLVMSTLHLRGQMVEVDLKGDITDDLTKAVQAAGGEIESGYPKFHAMRAWIPIDAGERLAARSDVRYIVPAAIARTASQPVKHPGSKPVRPLASRTGVAFSPFPKPSVPDQGGLIAHGANLVQAMGYTGAGIKVGVMSDGTDSLSMLQQQGYLPNNITVVSGQAGTGDEGTALMNVIYDMAPGVQMFFATANSSEAGMAANIETLVNTYHINILVDDTNWTDEGMFQPTEIENAIAYAASQGVLCFTAAGNNNNFDSGTAGTWLGDFVASGSTITVGTQNYPLLNFGDGVVENTVGPQAGNTSLQGLGFILEWSDPWDCSNNNYDLFVIQNGNVVGASTNQQNAQGCGGLPPQQYIDQGFANSSVVVAKAPSSAIRALWLSTSRATLPQRYSDYALQGHSGSVNEVSVAATDVAYTISPPAFGGGGIFTGGTANPVELISSDGPRVLFYDSNGNLLNTTAANPYTVGGGGGVTVNKVDITAADGVDTAVALYDPFTGTSAAAPHAAAIGALLKSADPYLTNADTITAMKSTALLITSPNIFQANGVFPRTQGAGIAMANLALGVIFPQINITSNPTGQSFTLAGSGCNPGPYVTPVTMKFPSDAACTVTLSNTTISQGAGAQLKFTAWSDGDTSNPKTIAIPVGGPVTYTANYLQQYQLTTAAFPSAGGSVTASPASSNGYYPSGTVVQLTATPANGYNLTQWSNDAGGTANPVFVTLSAPRNVIANFANPAISATSLSMMSESALAGQTVQIPIQMGASGAAVPSNFQFDLSFDSTKLAFTSAHASASLTGAGKNLGAQTVSGNIRFTSSGANQTALPSGTVAYATMTLNPQFTTGGTLMTMLNCSSTNAQATGLTTNCGTAIVEAGWCDVKGLGTVGAPDVQQIINEALGILPALNDLVHNGNITVGDVQLVINAALGMGCPY